MVPLERIWCVCVGVVLHSIHDVLVAMDPHGSFSFFTIVTRYGDKHRGKKKRPPLAAVSKSIIHPVYTKSAKPSNGCTTRLRNT